MKNSTCPRCQLPLSELAAPPSSRHTTCAGSIAYVRCACGAWLVVDAGEVLGATTPSLQRVMMSAEDAGV